MDNANLADATQFTFNAGSVSLEVYSFSITEGISIPFKATFDLISEDVVEASDVIKKEALLVINDGDTPRYLNGIALSFSHTGMTGRFYRYTVTMVPMITLMSMRKNYRIFQEKTTEDIISDLLKEAGIDSKKFEFNLTNPHEERLYCVQYKETDFEFINRICAEEGIFFFFEHYKDKHKLIFSDGPASHNPIQKHPKAMFNTDGGMVKDNDRIDRFSFSEQIKSGKASLKDFNYEKPSLDLASDLKDGDNTKLEIYDYPGAYTLTAAGEAKVKTTLEQAIMYKKMAKGRSDICQMLPGFEFRLTDHPIKKYNVKYILTNVTHKGKQPQVLEEFAEGSFSYVNNFTCVPKESAVRIEGGSKPIVHGIETAVVTGPKGEEIYTDELGRVKVQFHWDRDGKSDEKTSCWIRVSQGWAGAQWGSIFIPRIGHEVIVDFIGGDPDRPLITGSVYNAANKPPYKLPDDKTKSTVKSSTSIGGKGYNEIRFEDKKDEEEIFIHAQKDQNEVVENDLTRQVLNDQSISIKVNRSAKVLEGQDDLSVESGDRTVTISKGNELLDIKKGSREVKVKANESTQKTRESYIYKLFKGNS